MIDSTEPPRTRTAVTAVRVQHVSGTGRVQERAAFLHGKRLALTKQRETARRRLYDVQTEVDAILAAVDADQLSPEKGIGLLGRLRRTEMVVRCDLERLAIKIG